MSYSRRFHGRRGIKNYVFDGILVSGHPPGDTRRSERGPDRIQGGPGIDLRRFLVTFWLQWGSPADDFWCIFLYVSGISVTFSTVLFQSTFLASFLDGSVIPQTFKIWPNLCGVARKHSSPKIQKVGPGDRCWLHFGYLLE